MLTKGSDAVTFEAWSLFHAAYPHMSELSEHIIVGGTDVMRDWDSIVASLGKLEGNVRTLLCLSGMSPSVRQLGQLAMIPSLASLVLQSPQLSPGECVVERAVRELSRAARETSAFQQMKVLRISYSSHDAAQVIRVLEYLSYLPCLALVGLAQAYNTELVIKPPGKWQRVSSIEASTYMNIIHGEGNYSSLSSAARMQLLYDLSRYTDPSVGEPEDRKSPNTRGDGRVMLSMTCYNSFAESLRQTVTWYSRSDFSVDKANRKVQEHECEREGGDRGVKKKRKVRDGRAMDVGALLGSFG